MKPIRYVFVSFILALSLTACGANDRPTATIQNAPSPSPQLTANPTPAPSLQPSPSDTNLNKSTPTNSPTNIPTNTAPKQNAPSTSTPTSKPTPEAAPKVEKATVKIVSVTSPAARNSTATLKAKVAPGATATIVVHYKSGPSTAAGLETKTADSNGNVSWSWRVGGNTTIGSWRITVSSDGASAETQFEVVH